MSYEVVLKGNLVEVVEGADAYVAEGPLTTFFQGRDGRAVLDSWARRLASFRTGGHCERALGTARRRRPRAGPLQRTGYAWRFKRPAAPTAPALVRARRRR